ncbi:MAG: formylglycine-generating enzyme family protein [Bernardetiaceae bacterium]
MILRVVLVIVQTFLLSLLGCHPDTGTPKPAFSKPMVLVPAGSFQMGHAGRADTRAIRQVRLSAFYMDETPVTYRDFSAYVEAGGQPTAYWDYESYHQKNQPVTGITWHQAIDFCNWRSHCEGLQPVYRKTNQTDAWGYPVWESNLAANGYRLPTEAEFEYAARGGLLQKNYPWGDAFDPFKANHDNERGFRFGKWRLAKVEEQYRNAYGLYGMSGNIWHWCNDWYAPRAYELPDNQNNPGGPAPTATKVLRGGSWGSTHPEELTVYWRSYTTPGNYNYDIGFRCVRPLDPNKDPQTAQAESYTFWRPFAPIHSAPISDPYGEQMQRRLTDFIAQNFPNCLYFKEKIDQQEVLTPSDLAALIIETTQRYGIHPLFLTGIITAESGFATVSFPRWFNSPMAYEWQNRLMEAGMPEYNAPLTQKNRKYRDLREGFTAFCEGMHQKPWYKEVAQKDFSAFHRLYVGYEAQEWMRTVSRVYREVGGIHLSPHYPAQNVGALIFTRHF